MDQVVLFIGGSVQQAPYVLWPTFAVCGVCLPNGQKPYICSFNVTGDEAGAVTSVPECPHFSRSHFWVHYSMQPFPVPLLGLN